MSEAKTFELGEGRVHLTAELLFVGRDLLIILTGGTHPHIGSVTLLTQQEVSETHAFPSHDGRRHQDGILAASIAQQIKEELHGSCTITSGVHLDGISQEEIKSCLRLSKEMAEKISAYLATVKDTKALPKYTKKA